MAAAWACAAGAAPQVAVLLSDDSAVYRAVAEAVRGELAANPGAQVSIAVLAPNAAAALGLDAKAVVAVGARAARALAAANLRVPVLSTLVPRSTFTRIAVDAGRAGDTRHFSAVHLDQPLGRQFELIRQALPTANRVALILGAESEPLYPGAQLAAAERRLKVSAQKAASEQEIVPAMQKALSDADVLLALPDPLVFNSATLPKILLASYRQGLPVIGFSAAYVRAGAVLALYSTPEQAGTQAAEMLRGALATGHLPPPQHPRQFMVATNPHVARSLDMAIEDAATLTRKIMHAESQ